MIKYLLRENPLTSHPNDRMAQETDARTYSQEDLVEEMMKRGSSLTRSDIVAYQKLEAEVLADIIADGGHLSTPILNTSFSISGVFEDQNDSFDKARHTVRLNVNPGSALREAVMRVKVQKVEGNSTDPNITSVIDKVTGDNSTIKLGSVMEIRGMRLKFDAADVEQGVFVLMGGEEFRCDAIIENMPARLLVMLPTTLAEGDFEVEVRTKIGGDRKSTLKVMKRGAYNKTLSAVKPA